MLFPVTEISYISSDILQQQGAQTSHISFSLQDQIHKAKASEKNPNFTTFSVVALWKVVRKEFFPTELYFINVPLLLTSAAGHVMTTPPKIPVFIAGLQSEKFRQRRTFFFIRCRVGLLNDCLIASSTPTDLIFPALESGFCLLAQANSNLCWKYRLAYANLILSVTWKIFLAKL